MSGFDKFYWINAVMAEARLSITERYVLMCIAIRYVLNGDDGRLCVRQETIADRCAVSVRTVRGAMKRGMELGYLVLVRERERGRSRHRAHEHRLVIPANRADLSAGNTGTEIPAERAGSAGDTGTDCTEYRHGLYEIPARSNAATSKNNDPKGFVKGLEKGYGGDGPTCVNEGCDRPAMPEGDGRCGRCAALSRRNARPEHGGIAP